MNQKTPKKTRLVLVGGGHAHAVFLRDLKSIPSELEIELVSDSSTTLYSGRLTAVLAGQCSLAEASLPIAAFARKRGIRFQEAKALAIEPVRKQLVTSKGLIDYDYLSIDCGSSSSLLQLPNEAVFGVRPFESYFEAWQAVLMRPRDRLKVVQVGGGAAGCEVAATLLSGARRAGREVDLAIIEKGERLLKEAPERLSQMVERFFLRRGAKIFLQSQVTGAQAGQVIVNHAHGRLTLPSDFTSLALAPAPNELLKSLAFLQKTPGGFLSVDRTLRTSDPRIVALGDTAEFMDDPWPKAGVYAVRQGQWLVRNFSSFVTGQSMAPFCAQKTWLSLLNDGEGQAFGYRGRFTLPHARVTALLKSSIDKNFVRSFSGP